MKNGQLFYGESITSILMFLPCVELDLSLGLTTCLCVCPLQCTPACGGEDLADLRP